MSTDRVDVTIRIDPACPWAWLTSRWLAEVERVRPVVVTTALFDLAEANRGEEGRLRDSHSAGERALRVLVAARRAGGVSAVSRLYTELGEAYQERAHPLGEVATLAEAARAAGLDPGLAAQALDDETTVEELLAEHAAAVAAGCFGVPTLEIDGAAPIFGPIFDRRITGEDAGRLWDHTVWLIREGTFFELKRERTARAQVGRYAGAASGSRSSTKPRQRSASSVSPSAAAVTRSRRRPRRKPRFPGRLQRTRPVPPHPWRRSWSRPRW